MAPIWKKQSDKDDNGDDDDGDDTPSCLGICQALVQVLLGDRCARAVEGGRQSKSMRNDMGVAPAKELLTLG